VKFFQVWEGSAEAPEEQRQPSDRPEEEIWIVEEIYIQEELDRGHVAEIQMISRTREFIE
jgi:hypothetical protein